MKRTDLNSSKWYTNQHSNDVTVISFSYLFFFPELKPKQNISHDITEFHGTIILSQRKPKS